MRSETFEVYYMFFAHFSKMFYNLSYCLRHSLTRAGDVLDLFVNCIVLCLFNVSLIFNSLLVLSLAVHASK